MNNIEFVFFIPVIAMICAFAFVAAEQAEKKTAYLEQCQATDTKYNCLLAWDKEEAK